MSVCTTCGCWVGCLLRLVWVLFVAFTTFHLLANYRAVRVVTMETLNQARLHLVMTSYLREGKVPSVNVVNLREPILASTGRRLHYALGVSLSDVLPSVKQQQRALCVLHYESSKRCVRVALHRECGTSTQLKAAIAVEVLDYLVQNGWTPRSPPLLPHHQALNRGSPSSKAPSLSGDIPGLLPLAQQVVENLYPDLTQQLSEAGWITSHLFLSVGEWRYSWEPEKQL